MLGRKSNASRQLEINLGSIRAPQCAFGTLRFSRRALAVLKLRSVMLSRWAVRSESWSRAFELRLCRGSSTAAVDRAAKRNHEAKIMLDLTIVRTPSDLRRKTHCEKKPREQASYFGRNSQERKWSRSWCGGAWSLGYSRSSVDCLGHKR